MSAEAEAIRRSNVTLRRMRAVLHVMVAAEGLKAASEANASSLIDLKTDLLLFELCNSLKNAGYQPSAEIGQTRPQYNETFRERNYTLPSDDPFSDD